MAIRLKERLRIQDPESYVEGDFEYDVFISYSNEETAWVNEQLLPALGKYMT